MSRKSDLRKLIVAHFPDCIVKPEHYDRVQSAPVVVNDILGSLLQMSPTRMSVNQTIEVCTSSDMIEKIRKYLVANYSRKVISLVADKSAYVPPHKGPTQRSRSAGTAEARAIEEAQRAETRGRMTFLNTDAFIDTTHQLHLIHPAAFKLPTAESDPFDLLRTVLSESLGWRLPQPWQDVLSSNKSDARIGGREMVMRYVVRCLTTDGIMPYVPPEWQSVYIDGHGFTMAEFALDTEAYPLLGRSNGKPPTKTPEGEIDDLPVSPIKLMRSTEDPSSDVPDVEICEDYLKNSVGEGEACAITHVHALFENRPELKEFVIVSRDTDNIANASWYLWKRLAGGFETKHDRTAVPQIWLDLTTPKKKTTADGGCTQERFIIDVNRLCLDLETKFYPEVIPSFFAAMAAAASDFTHGYHRLPMRCFMEAMLRYGTTLIKPLVVFPHGPARAAKLDGNAYRMLVSCAYYILKETPLRKKGIDLPQPLDIMRDTLRGVILTAADRRLLFDDRIENFPDNPNAFKKILNKMKRCIPENFEILNRGLLLANYVSMIHQIGNSSIDFTDAVKYGYRKVDPKLPPTTYNLAYVASVDYINLSERWIEYQTKRGNNTADLMSVDVDGDGDD